MILIVLPVCKEDAQRAELLLDLVYQLEGRKAKGFCVLAFAPDVHPEMRDKLFISAQLAFESVDLHHIQKLTAAGSEKRDSISAMFSECARFIANSYRAPWLWLEPDCMPLKAGWRDELSAAYENQPRRYLSRWLKSGEIRFIARVGVYPVNIIDDMEIANVSNIPFPASVVSKSTVCDLFQEQVVTTADDVNKVRSNAVLLHGDKAGVLADWVRSKMLPVIAGKPDGDWVSFGNEHIGGHAAPEATTCVDENADTYFQQPKRRGRKPKSELVTV